MAWYEVIRYDIYDGRENFFQDGREWESGDDGRRLLYADRRTHLEKV